MPSNQKASGVSIPSVNHLKFMPKNPVTNVRGRKIVATTVSS